MNHPGQDSKLERRPYMQMSQCHPCQSVWINAVPAETEIPSLCTAGLNQWYQQIELYSCQGYGTPVQMQIHRTSCQPLLSEEGHHQYWHHPGNGISPMSHGCRGRGLPRLIQGSLSYDFLLDMK